MSECAPFDGLGVLESLLGLTGCGDAGVALTAAGRVEGCMHPVPKPGPCKGHRRNPLAPKTRSKSSGSGRAKPKGTAKGSAPEKTADREKRVEQAVNDSFGSHATVITEKLPNGAWKAERDRMHREIVEEMYSRAATVPRDGKALIAGGLGGAGKSTVLRDHAGVKPDDYFTVNSDDIKEEMAKRDMIPTIPGHEDLSPMERVGLIHQESSRIASMLADKAYRDKRNMIWDLTMSSENSVRPHIDALRKSGYGEIRSVFVDIPMEKSLDRAMGRYRSGQADWEKGTGLGGRFVPPDVIRAQGRPDGGTYNRDNFDRLKDEFDDWSIYDNSVDGRPPKIIDKKGA